MPDLWMDVDAALAEVPVNIMPLLDDTTFKDIEGAVAYNAAGMALRWHFVTCAGAYTVTSVTPTTGGNYDWTDQGDSGIYTIEIPASGGASINNDTEGFGWFTGVATGVLPWRGPVIGFRAAGLNDKMIESAYDTTRGLAGTALPAAAAEAAGGLYTRGTGAGQINQDGNGRIDSNVAAISTDTTAADNCELMFDGTGYAGGTTKLKVDVETIKTQAVTCAAGVTVPTSIASPTNITAGTITTVTNLTNLPSIPAGWITAAGIATDAIDNDAIAADVSAVIADAVWNAATASYGTANTYGALVESGNVGGGAIVAASVTGAVGSVTGAVGSVTGNVGGNVTGSVGSVATGGITANSIADNAIDLATFAADCKTGSALKANVETITAGAITATAIATGAIDADALAADAVDEILDEVVEGSVTLRQAIRLILSALTGKASGGGTTTITFRDIGDSKDRIVMTVDSSGNRSAVSTRDGS